MKQVWMVRMFGVVLAVLGGGFLVNASANAQVIDLFEGKEIGSESAGLVVEGISEEVASAEGPQVERGGSGAGLTHGGQALRLPFERSGSNIRVKAKVQGRTVYFMLDTGATYSTLTPGFAKELGLLPGAGNPKTLAQTANGLVEQTFGLIPRLELGDRMHSRVSFVVCASCGDMGGEHPSVGLLGLNVLRRYRMTIDDKHGIVELLPQGEFSNQRDDIMPWLELGFEQKVVKEGRGTKIGHVLQVKNLSAHGVQDVEVGLTCRQGSGAEFEEVLSVAKIASKGSGEVRLPQPPEGCEDHQFLLRRARW